MTHQWTFVGQTCSEMQTASLNIIHTNKALSSKPKVQVHLMNVSDVSTAEQLQLMIVLVNVT